ncbi:MAG: FecR domain-containing protein [Verrucomicrobiae bacterium]
MINDRESFEFLCNAVLEGTASEAQLDQFQQQLRGSAAVRKAYAQQTQIHALLIWQQGRVAVPTSVVLSPMDFAPASPTLFSQWLGNLIPIWGRVLAGAAAVMMILGLTFWFGFGQSQKNSSVAVHKNLPVAAQKGISVDILAASESPYQVGQRVVLERLEMKIGSLRFRISSGAVVDVEGPVDLEFVDAMRLRLLRGNVTTDVGTEAKGFVVDTASARVLDLGTRFGVSVGDDGATDVVVLQGEVEVHRAGEPLTLESRLASLYEGDAARMASREAKIQRLQAAALSGDRLAISGLNAPASSVVTDVTDNIKKANFYRCYTIVPGGMTQGALASLVHRGHRKLTWLSLPDQPFPEELQGADVIGTFQGEVIRKELPDISLDLARPCSVYVMFDSRATPPDWLKRDFKDTGLRLRSGPWWSDLLATKNLKPDANGELYIVHSVWRRDVPAAGTVTLGAPFIKGENRPYAMYGIAVKALN